jgi:hypothetical protein
MALLTETASSAARHPTRLATPRRLVGSFKTNNQNQLPANNAWANLDHHSTACVHRWHQSSVLTTLQVEVCRHGAPSRIRHQLLGADSLAALPERRLTSFSNLKQSVHQHLPISFYVFSTVSQQLLTFLHSVSCTHSICISSVRHITANHLHHHRASVNRICSAQWILNRTLAWTTERQIPRRFGFNSNPYSTRHVLVTNLLVTITTW